MKAHRTKSRVRPTSLTRSAFVAPHLALIRVDALQRVHVDLREVFDALRSIVWAATPRQTLPHDFPPWEVTY